MTQPENIHQQNGTAKPGDEKEQREPVSRARRGYILGVITAIYAMNYMDRSILGVVLDPIKKEFALSDTMLGLMIGPGFGITYALLGVPIARLADRYRRVPIITAGLTFWSVMTALGGVATNAWHVFFARIGTGLGQSTGAAPGQAIISDYYTKDKRPFAFSLYHFGPAIGLYAALLIGGVSTHYWGWRAAFFIAGIPGIIVALLFYFTVKEPARGLSDGGKADTKYYKMVDTLRYLLTNKTYLLCMGGMLLVAFMNFTMSSWMPSFFRRVHRLNYAQIGVYAGTVKTVLGLCGALAGGIIVSAKAKRDDRLKLVWPGAACLVGAGAYVIFFLAEPLAMVYVGLGLSAFAIAFSQGPVSAIIQTVLKVRMRSFGSGIGLLAANLLAFSGAPVLVGIMNDILKDRFGAQAVRYSMLIAAVAVVLAAMCFFLAIRSVRKDVERAMEENSATHMAR